MSQLGYGFGDAVAVPFDFYVPVTGFSITPSTNKLVLNPAGTLATGTVNLPLNPQEGQQLTIVSTKTQTALTITPNTGDAVVGASAVTALVAGVPVQYAYSLTGAKGTGVNARTWVRIL